MSHTAANPAPKKTIRRQLQVCVSAVVVWEGKCLVGFKKPYNWQFPSAWLEWGSSCASTAEKTIKDNIGLDVEAVEDVAKVDAVRVPEGFADTIAEAAKLMPIAARGIEAAIEEYNEVRALYKGDQGHFKEAWKMHSPTLKNLRTMTKGMKTL
ncbi:hypothetical protein E4U42_004860 [Claviceps africana]|uniref:Nudix hydrolase domain-containing protein n=1 Tax=Claviceps africana TaxID=83212 RepID=A0A8K0J5K7_9HYPO|nr:hypothetical protein E4U42_004860 [Claviceps africana]